MDVMMDGSVEIYRDCDSAFQLQNQPVYMTRRFISGVIEWFYLDKYGVPSKINPSQIGFIRELETAKLRCERGEY